jgi:hypothetical protein
MTITLDVRPVLARGEEPFDAIMEAAAGISEAGTLELLAPFEPVPLYRVLSRRGFGHRTAPLNDGGYRVWFTRTGIVPGATIGAVYERYPDTGPVFARHGMDLCCGSGKTLEFAARAHKADLGQLLEALQQAAWPADHPAAMPV